LRIVNVIGKIRMLIVVGSPAQRFRKEKPVSVARCRVFLFVKQSGLPLMLRQHAPLHWLAGNRLQPD